LNDCQNYIPRAVCLREQDKTQFCYLSRQFASLNRESATLFNKTVDTIKIVGKKKFTSTRSKHGFSQKSMADLLNISSRTLDSWLDNITSPNEKQTATIKTILLSEGLIDENWNVLENPVAKPQHPAALAAELEKYKAEREEMRSELTNAIKEVNGHLHTSLKYLDRVRYLESLLNKNNIDFDEME
jgi:DNA-binding transcriptional regulator YiaG